MTSWFNVDKHGLAKLMEGRDRSFILNELIQNAWDEASSRVDVTVEPAARGHVTISVEDDNPEGFADITHAYTLFAESKKKGDATKRGRFNMGEKLVLALARTASVETTKGSVNFCSDGTRRQFRPERKSGSKVTVEIKMSRDEMEQMIASTRKLIAPIPTFINGEQLPKRQPVGGFTAKLPTLVATEDGVLRPTQRVTEVLVYEPLPGETAMIYEMGIPVVETGDQYHVDVHQKVPLNMDRDNVTPSFLRQVRVAVLNEFYNHVSDPAETWVKEACADKNVKPEAVRTVIEKRFGAGAVAYDPSDREANKLSTADGRTVVHGGSLSAGEWANVKVAGALLPAGQVTPSPKPFSPDGNPLAMLDPDLLTPGMVRVANFTKRMGNALLGADVTIQFANDNGWPFKATFSRELVEFIFNVAALDAGFFNAGIWVGVIELVIHEFGHYYESDHLSERYYDALTDLGARMTKLALEHPELFQ